MKKALIIFTACLITALAIGARPVQASDLSVRVEQPDSPTRDKSFKLVFVSLDIQSRPISVSCYFKKPSGGFTQFDSSKSVAAGGGTSYCQVSDSMLSEQGGYQFYVTAAAGSDTATSQTVTVDYDTSGPDTPTNYAKEKVSSCTYRINFKTADDGQTTKVEIYRSESTSFNLDSGTKIGEVGIGPNQNGEYNNNPPDCNKTYYYVIRAVDSAGNVSSPVGDTGATVTSSSSSTSTTPGAIPVNSDNDTTGSILGKSTQDDTTSEEQVEAEEDSSDSNSAGQVAGEETTADSDSADITRNSIIAVIAALLVGAFFLRRRSKK